MGQQAMGASGNPTAGGMNSGPHSMQAQPGQQQPGGGMDINAILAQLRGGQMGAPGGGGMAGMGGGMPAMGQPGQQPGGLAGIGLGGGPPPQLGPTQGGPSMQPGTMGGPPGGGQGPMPGGVPGMHPGMRQIPGWQPGMMGTGSRQPPMGMPGGGGQGPMPGGPPQGGGMAGAPGFMGNPNLRSMQGPGVNVPAMYGAMPGAQQGIMSLLQHFGTGGPMQPQQ